jgi:hypothetical protein
LRYLSTRLAANLLSLWFSTNFASSHQSDYYLRHLKVSKEFLYTMEEAVVSRSETQQSATVCLFLEIALSIG